MSGNGLTGEQVRIGPEKIVIAIIIEVTYAVFTRTWLRAHAQGTELEVLVSVGRLITAGIYWFLFRDLIVSRSVASVNLRHPLLFAGVATVLAIPFLFRGWSPGGGIGTAVVFFVTSIIVGVREELLYRVILINLLLRRFGVPCTLLISTALFLAYHYGTVPIASTIVIEITCMSFLLGLMYVYSGSMLAVMALHSAFDGIWFFGPYLDNPLSDVWRPAFHITGLALVLLWTRLIGRAHLPVRAN